MTTERERASALLAEATARVVRTVDRLHDADWSGPSLLPGWSRAHVVAHLTLNAEGMARALHGLVTARGEVGPHPMYDSDERRDSDIEELTSTPPSAIRERLMAATTVLEDAVDAVPEDRWSARIERTPGGRLIRAAAFPGMRLRELEIHHVDLDTGYTTREWSADFSGLLLDAMAKRVDPPTSFEVRPLDLDRVWTFGPDASAGPVVTGPGADIGWWLTGRPAADTVHCSRGELPSIEGW